MHTRKQRRKVTLRETMRGDFDIRIDTCPICGKRFRVYDPNDWVYKRYRPVTGIQRRQLFCSYSCLLAYDEKFNAFMEARKQERTQRRKKKCVAIRKD